MHGSASWSEQFLGDHLEKRGFEVARSCLIGRYEIDLLVQDTVIIEIDGYHHLAKDRQLVDRKKDRYLRGVGYEVLRIPASEVRDPESRDALARKIEAILDTRRAASMDERPHVLSPEQMERLQKLHERTAEDRTERKKIDDVSPRENADEEDSEDLFRRYLDEHFPEQER